MADPNAMEEAAEDVAQGKLAVVEEVEAADVTGSSASFDRLCQGSRCHDLQAQSDWDGEETSAVMTRGVLGEQQNGPLTKKVLAK